MQLKTNWLFVLLLVTVLPFYSAVAQKVEVGYDKSVDFSRYTSYTWAEPELPVVRPVLYTAVVGSVDYQLKSKRLARTQQNGDLILVPAGGIDFGLNAAAATPILGTYSGPPPALNATVWTGTTFSSSMTTYVPEGTLMLSFVDRSANKVIWTGTVKVKLDVEHKKKSLELVDKAISKLLKKFPPK